MEVPADPVLNDTLQLRQATFKKMVGAFNQHEFFWLRGGCHSFTQLLLRAELVKRTADKQLGPCAVVKKLISIYTAFRGNGSTEGNQGCDIEFRTCCPQACCGAERKAAEHHRQAKF